MSIYKLETAKNLIAQCRTALENNSTLWRIGRRAEKLQNKISKKIDAAALAAACPKGEADLAASMVAFNAADEYYNWASEAQHGPWREAYKDGNLNCPVFKAQDRAARELVRGAAEARWEALEAHNEQVHYKNTYGWESFLTYEERAEIIKGVWDTPEGQRAQDIGNLAKQAKKKFLGDIGGYPDWKGPLEDLLGLLGKEGVYTPYYAHEGRKLLLQLEEEVLEWEEALWDLALYH